MSSYETDFLQNLFFNFFALTFAHIVSAVAAAAAAAAASVSHFLSLSLFLSLCLCLLDFHSIHFSIHGIKCAMSNGLLTLSHENNISLSPAAATAAASLLVLTATAAAAAAAAAACVCIRPLFA